MNGIPKSVKDLIPNSEGEFIPTSSYTVLYVYAIWDEAHEGLLKIGKTTISTTKQPDELTPDCNDLNKAAEARINKDTKTPGIKYHIVYTTLAYKEITVNGKKHVVSKNANNVDKQVHSILKASGYSPKYPNGITCQEWFEVTLPTAKNAINALMEGRTSLKSTEIVTPEDAPFIIRQEQLDAIEKTETRFKTKSTMLWNAKMRYGKTATALELVRRNNYRRVIIVTHRPVVGPGWQEDFYKIFKTNETAYEFLFKSKDKPEDFENFDDLTKDAQNDAILTAKDKSGAYFVYFASVQDLRGSYRVNQKTGINKNKAVFEMEWDLVINDEAHEGTQTSLGQGVFKELIKKNTKVLSLSGTPFNILSQYDTNGVYTWDYIMEQEAKEAWYIDHPDEPNPYEGLPKMHMRTYDLSNIIAGYKDYDVSGKAFNFKEFFRTWTGEKKFDGVDMPKDAVVGEFMHPDDVDSFLNLLTTPSDKSQYPYSTPEYRDMFRHTLWMVPGVKEAKALYAKLKGHSVFGNGFGIVNVAGSGDADIYTGDPLKDVKTAIENYDYTITLSCGKLTTGVTVKEWTAVFMLAGSSTVSASDYLQTIFRCQSPGEINGKIKEHCYVFDFAPDRSLRVFAEAANSTATATEVETYEILRKFVNYCPIIAYDGSRMLDYDVEKMLQQIKRVQVEHAIRSGFDDTSIYNNNALLTLNELDAKKFNDLERIVGKSKAQRSAGKVKIANGGMTKEEWEELQRRKKERNKQKPKPPLSEEEKEKLRKLKEAKKQRQTAISILRAISIRMPLLIYGADVPFDKDITIEEFVDYVDPVSWEEFMPKGVSKDRFKDFIQYYDKDVFVSAGREIRRLAKDADDLSPTERVKKITEIFNYFKNPDKETVLTPWRVVNMHLSETVGGWCFYNKDFEENTPDEIKRPDRPRFVSQGAVTGDVFRTDSKVLEINSKSGLYPLYVAYSIYRAKLGALTEDEVTPAAQQKYWLETVRENLYVLCKTPMAVRITRRTLLGYKDAESNLAYMDKLVDSLQKSISKTVSIIQKPSFWNKEGDIMKFDAVVGNPPYQEETEAVRKPPIYNYFYDMSFELSKRVSLISPGRFLFDAGQTPSEWNQKMLSDPHFKVVKYFGNSKDVFDTVDIKGGVVITYRDSDMDFGKIGLFVVHKELKMIYEKVCLKENNFINSIIASQGLYRFTNAFFETFPSAKEHIGSGTGNKIVSNIMEKMPNAFSIDSSNTSQDIRMMGYINSRRDYRYIDRKYIQANDYLDKFNVLIPEANGTGTFGEVLTLPTISMPGEGAADSYLSAGLFDTENEAYNFLQYFKTKFFRALLGLKKSTHHCPPNVWEMIPMQNFTELSDINWNHSVSDVDQQLYIKYNLSKEEIEFIETNVQSMDSES